MPNARCSVDRVRNCGSGRIDYDLTDGFRAERARRLVALFKFHVERAHIQASWDLILHKGGFDRLADGIVGHVFHQRMTDALYDTALRLDSCQRGV